MATNAIPYCDLTPVTAREAADRYDSDSDSLTKTKYFRKRRNLAPTETEIKRLKCGVIALCVYFTHL